ncbi:hypothetical protein ACFV6F_15035 [Kitasatospora phosalacinea]|uniref:hypothetical protein n=1 Tax=Kitasatospora phosalacinea TaxID=2065 RepID=UPI0036588BE7
MIQFLVLLAAAAIGAAVAVTFWNGIVEAVSRWLREHGLADSDLMAAVVTLDRLAVGVRQRLTVRTPAGFTVILDEELDLDDIDDPQVLAELERRGYFEIDLLND